MSTSLDSLQGFRFFEDAVARLMSEPRTGRPWSPAVDIMETEDALTLRADLPDVKQDDIDLRVENQTLTISGHRKFERDENVKGYHRIERSYGDFVRSFAIPSTMDTENVKAEYTNGVLTVTLPKREAAKPRQIKIAVQNGAASETPVKQ